MSALVVYESMFGSTRDVAHAVADGLRETVPVRVVEVGALLAEPGGTAVPEEVTLLVVGGPTHAFGMSRESTRTSAAREARTGAEALVSPHAGIREWLDVVRMPAHTLLVATFDTKLRRPNLPGSAARSAERALRHRGAVPVVEARSFEVLGMADGLAEGELAAAQEWGRLLAGTLPAAR
ncbi:flavodoxin family protein [Cellulomonas sp. P4]|uniref:flavodoxin family protein n=1 Tax=Cellulomonas sp. P4 TaxID=3142533 RepID=UPI0031BB88DB